MATTTKKATEADPDDVPKLDDLILVADVCRRFGVTEQCGRMWIWSRENALKGWRLGNRWYTTEVAIQDFMRARTAAAPCMKRAAAGAEKHHAAEE